MKLKVWNKEIINFCPGIGKGKLYSYKKIKEILLKDKDNNKKIINNY